MYFSKFPIMQYPVKDGNTTRYAFVRNLMRRVAVSETLKNEDGLFLEYRIKDGERPEHIAERVYGNAQFHWLVLLVNETIDPYHGWCKSENALEEYVGKKYGGYAVFVTNTNDTFLYNSAIVSGCSLSQGSSRGEIYDYTPEFCRLTVRNGAFTEGSATIGLTSGSSLSVTIQRVDESYRSVHHFQMTRPSTDTGAEETPVLDPLSQQTSSYSVVGGVVGNTENEYPSSGFGLTYAGSGTVDLWETYIGGYMGISGSAINTYSVSNLTYEIEQNDIKRKIRILHPRYKKIAVQELEALLRV
jgi:hypothetical protein